jgi:geranylgeranyl diphosphate synthase type I
MKPKGVQMNIPVVFHEYMGLINQNLAHVFERDDPAIKDLALYHIQAGGKRLRPILCMLTCQGLGGTQKAVLPYALTLEILHNVSLIFDDMIDENPLRRGKPSLHMKFGVENALVTANYLTWKALEIFSENTKSEALRELALSARMISLGEKLDIDFSRLSEQDYVRICEAKTSYQFRVSSFLGAIAATDDERILEESRTFGTNLGFAFQIQDDVLNIVGKEKIFGKPTGTDFSGGRPNYVIVKAYQILGEKMYEGDAQEKIRTCGAVEESTKIALEYLRKAKKFLNFFTVDKYRTMLDELINFVVKRTF